jgi:hypothetical protein
MLSTTATRFSPLSDFISALTQWLEIRAAGEGFLLLMANVWLRAQPLTSGAY